ncbi:MAG: guanylate kinase [Cytophagales bacterium]|nr:MAG: guanylate kinase [Rhodothermaeota bacterium MED-G18]
MKSKYFIISAPSGSGKSSLANYLLSKDESLAFSISSTTRTKRENEIDGVHYYFISKEQFKEHIKLNDFIEWEQVYADDFKGTLKSEIKRLVNLGKNIIFDVDVVGGLNLKKYFGEEALSIFIDVPSFESLKERLETRGSEADKEIQERINKAKFEVTKKDLFDVILMNDNLSEASPQIHKLVKNFLIK